MTMLAAVSGGMGVLVLAADSAQVSRSTETGAIARVTLPADRRDDPLEPYWLRHKLHALSTRRPLAVGVFGLSGSREWGPEASAYGAFARCRARFDATDAELTVEAVAEAVAREIHSTFAERFREMARHGWVPKPTAEGVLHGGAFSGGIVAGYCEGGPPEAWFFITSLEYGPRWSRTFLGGPNLWGVAMPPGSDAAMAGLRQVMRNEVPRTLERAAALAAQIIALEAAAERTDGTVIGGPVQCLGLRPGAPPARLELVAA
jgi:hypothetical protein